LNRSPVYTLYTKSPKRFVNTIVVNTRRSDYLVFVSCAIIVFEKKKRKNQKPFVIRRVAAPPRSSRRRCAWPADGVIMDGVATTTVSISSRTHVRFAKYFYYINIMCTYIHIIHGGITCVRKDGGKKKTEKKYPRARVRVRYAGREKNKYVHERVWDGEI